MTVSQQLQAGNCPLFAVSPSDIHTLPCRNRQCPPCRDAACRVDRSSADVPFHRCSQRDCPPGDWLACSIFHTGLRGIGPRGDGPMNYPSRSTTTPTSMMWSSTAGRFATAKRSHRRNSAMSLNTRHCPLKKTYPGSALGSSSALEHMAACS
jgi:hypothetical protein